jgi:hypothetical protein
MLARQGLAAQLRLVTPPSGMRQLDHECGTVRLQVVR